MNRFAVDILERATVTFGEAFAAALLLSLVGAPALPSLSLVEKAAGAGVVAVLALLKGLFAGLLGNNESAALLPSSVDPIPVTVNQVVQPVGPAPIQDWDAAQKVAHAAHGTKKAAARKRA